MLLESPVTMNHNPIAFLFPGQGSQYVGMGRSLLNTSAEARAIFDLAATICGRDIQNLCLNGPEEALKRTDNLQPAITAVNLSALACLKQEGIVPSAVAGHSLGEFSAYHAAGVTSLEDTLRLVHLRGALMHREAELKPGRMVAVTGLPLEQVASTLQDARQTSGAPVQVANHNAPTQIVISGAADAVSIAVDLLDKAGGACTPLPVSGAWHSELMRAAQEEFTAFLDTVTFHPANIDVLPNLTGQPERDATALRRLAGLQICESVRWVDTVSTLVTGGFRIFVEVGPRRVLSGLLRKMLRGVSDARTFTVESPEDVAPLAEALSKLAMCVAEAP